MKTAELKKFNIVCKGCNSKKYITLGLKNGQFELECQLCQNMELFDKFNNTIVKI